MLALFKTCSWVHFHRSYPHVMNIVPHTFTFVCVIGDMQYQHFCKSRHITFTLHVYDMTFISGGGGDGGGVTGEKAASVSTFVRPLEAWLPSAFCASTQRKRLNLKKCKVTTCRNVSLQFFSGLQKSGLIGN